MLTLIKNHMLLVPNFSKVDQSNADLVFCLQVRNNYGVYSVTQSLCPVSGITPAFFLVTGQTIYYVICSTQYIVNKDSEYSFVIRRLSYFTDLVHNSQGIPGYIQDSSLVFTFTLLQNIANKI